MQHNYIGNNVILLNTVDSTNAYLQRNPDLPCGTVVSTEYQTKGKGRGGKIWISERNNGLLFSFKFKPNILAKDSVYLMYLTSVVLSKYLNEKYNISAGIKWPNDIYIENKKLAGILLEAKSGRKSIKYVVIGIGVNISENQDKKNLPDNYSFLDNYIEKFYKLEFLFGFIDYFNTYYHSVIANENFFIVVSDWNKLCIHIDKMIEITTHSQKNRYIFKRLDESGAILVESEMGHKLLTNVEDIICC